MIDQDKPFQRSVLFAMRSNRHLWQSTQSKDKTLPNGKRMSERKSANKRETKSTCSMAVNVNSHTNADITDTLDTNRREKMIQNIKRETSN